jgi:hypothetical protein
VRTGIGSPVTRKKTLLRNYAIAAGVSSDNIPSVHTPIYGYVQPLQEEAVDYQGESRRLRTWTVELNAQHEEVRGG